VFSVLPFERHSRALPALPARIARAASRVRRAAFFLRRSIARLFSQRGLVVPNFLSTSRLLFSTCWRHSTPPLAPLHKHHRHHRTRTALLYTASLPLYRLATIHTGVGVLRAAYAFSRISRSPARKPMPTMPYRHRRLSATLT